MGDMFCFIKSMLTYMTLLRSLPDLHRVHWCQCKLGVCVIV